MLQDNRDKFNQPNQPFSRPASTIKVEVAGSLFHEPNNIALNLAKMRHYICLCYFQNVGLVTKYCAHFKLNRYCDWVCKTDGSYLKEWPLGWLTEPFQSIFNKTAGCHTSKNTDTPYNHNQKASFNFTWGMPCHGLAGSSSASCWWQSSVPEGLDLKGRHVSPCSQELYLSRHSSRIRLIHLQPQLCWRWWNFRPVRKALCDSYFHLYSCMDLVTHIKTLLWILKHQPAFEDGKREEMMTEK